MKYAKLHPAELQFMVDMLKAWYGTNPDGLKNMYCKIDIERSDMCSVGPDTLELAVKKVFGNCYYPDERRKNDEENVINVMFHSNDGLFEDEYEIGSQSYDELIKLFQTIHALDERHGICTMHIDVNTNKKFKVPFLKKLKVEQDAR